MKRLLSGMISLLLAAFLAIMLLPGFGANADIVDSGTCGANGDNIRWALDSEGILTIQGSGKMKDWETADDHSPWYECADVKTVVIGKDVTSIGNYAFYDCFGLKEITIPDSVTSIGNWAFGFCTGLKEITIPDSVTSIGNYAFYQCSGLKEITIPDRVTSIGKYTFYYCRELKEITIPDSVTSIGNGAFGWCEKLESITIPDSVTSIGNGAIYSCTELKEITIPDSVTSIGESAFAYCENLESITIPDSVTSIGASTFVCCYNLESIIIPDSVTSIDLDAFNDCSSLKKIVFPDKESYAFDQSCFAGCTSIETVIVNSEAELNPVVFSDCSSSFESYYYYDVIYSAENGTVEGKSRSYAGDILELDITPDENYIVDKVTLNGNEILSDENGKYICTMPDSEDSVTIEATFMPGGKCGADGDNITWALNSEGILTIQGSGKMKDWNNTNDPSPWYRCADVKTVVIGKDVTSIGNYAFYYCSGLKEITIPDSVTSIGNYAFYYCSELKEITIPDSVTSIGNWTFHFCSGLKEITIPDSVTSIGNYAFYYCSGLKEITIPDSVTSIGNYAFYYCSGLKEITIPDSVTSIGNGAFDYCENLESITIPDSVTSIGVSTFEGCSRLESITIPDSVTSIDNGAFVHCEKLESITIPDSVTSIGNYAFYYCSGLKEIIIPDSVTSIGYEAFGGCGSLKKIVFPDKKSYAFDKSCFAGCTGIETVIVNSEAELNPVVFSDCSSSFESYYYYDVIYSAENGTVEGKSRSYAGDILELDITPDENYIVDKVTVNGNEILSDENGKYICTMPDSEDAVKFNVSFKLKQKEVTFCIKDGDKTIELQKSNVDMTTVPAYAGSDPTKDPDDQFTYTFTGWTDGTTTYDKDDVLPAVYDDITYTAVFKSESKQAVINPEVKASFEAFVERMYVVVLGRPSEPEGKTYWTDKVINGELTGADCARNFLNGQEFKDRNLSDEEFVTVLYKAFFDRDAKDDPDGFNFWMESLKVTGRENIIEGFISSPEWIDLCSEYGVKPGTAKEVTGSAADFATRLYTECLGREPDEEGLKYWSQGLADHKLTGSQAAHEFFYSAEFNSLDLGNKELITRMYKTFLGRDPEDEGLSFWMDSMDKGMTKDQLFDSFVDSKEFSEICERYSINR